MSRTAKPTSTEQVKRATGAVKFIKGAILLGAAAAGMAQAQQSPALDRASITVGGFYADPEIHIGGDTRYGRVDTPDEDLDHTTLPRAKAEILIGDSHGLSFDYFRFSKGFGGDFSGDAVYEGRDVTASGRADAKLRLEMARASYKWWLGKENDVFGIGVGAAYLRAKISGSAEATATATAPAQSWSWSGSESASDSVWAPTVELAWRHSFNEKWRMYVDASGIKKNGGTIEGHIYNGAIGVEYFPARNIGLVFDYGIQNRPAPQRRPYRRPRPETDRPVGLPQGPLLRSSPGDYSPGQLRAQLLSVMIHSLVGTIAERMT